MSEEDYWATSDGLLSRVEMLASNFIHSTYNWVIDKLRGDQSVEWLTGNTPCPTCAGYAGIYQSEDELPDIPGEVHPNCECILNIIP